MDTPQCSAIALRPIRRGYLHGDSDRDGSPSVPKESGQLHAGSLVARTIAQKEARNRRNGTDDRLHYRDTAGRCRRNHRNQQPLKPWAR
jgi:hypothetical protein